MASTIYKSNVYYGTPDRTSRIRTIGEKSTVQKGSEIIKEQEKKKVTVTTGGSTPSPTVSVSFAEEPTEQQKVTTVKSIPQVKQPSNISFSKTTDASYTQGGLTYDPTTKTLLPDQTIQNLSKPKPNALTPYLQNLPSPTSTVNKPKINLIKSSWNYLNDPKNIGLKYTPGSPTFFTLSNKPTITFEKIKGVYGTYGGMPGKVVGEFIPTTPLQFGITSVLPYGYTKIPTIARVGLSGYFSYEGFKSAINKDEPTEKRIAGGIIGGLGAFGIAQETTPFIKGQIYKLYPNYKPVKTFTTTQGESYKAIDIKDKSIALIPVGDISTATKPAYLSTAYGFPKSYQSQYIDTIPTSYSSAKGLFKFGKTNVQIESDFFATPQDIVTGQGQTRVSRLGSGFKEFFKFPESTGELTTKSGQPQIIEFKTPVTAKEQPGTFQVGPSRQSTELEIFKRQGKTNDIIKSTGLIGRTTIAGRGVKIYGGEIKPGEIIGNSKVIKSSIKSSTSLNDYYVSPSGISSSFGVSRFNRKSSIKHLSPSVSAPSYPTPSTPKYPSVSAPSYPTPSTPKYAFPLLSSGYNQKNIFRQFKGKQPKKYVPSYEAFIFKIKGKVPSGRETGSRLRPIPKDYSFAYKLPKFKLNIGR